MIQTIKTKAAIYLLLLHVGLALFLFSMARDPLIIFGGQTFTLLLAGAGLMYGAFVFGVLSIWRPLRPWVARYQRTKNWHTWILHELPTLLALIPVLFAAMRILKSAWGEIKAFQADGQLNVQNLAGVAQRFAKEAECLAQQPGAEMIKTRLKDAA